MTLREKLREHFNVEAITAEPASETWFKTQQECAEAIRREARRV